MIKHIDCDILDSGADVICHQVNCRGIMGAGLAMQIRKKYPSVYMRYRDFVTGTSDANSLMGFTLWTSVNEDQNVPFIVNCFSQKEYGRTKCFTDYNALRSCFCNVAKICSDSYESCMVAIPYKIGCGLAGGDWSIVEPIIMDAFANYSGEVLVCKHTTK